MVTSSGSPVKRLIHSWFSVIIGQGVSSIAPILLVPLYLSAWGTTAYGEWLILSATVSYLGTLDLGVQNYVVNRLTQSHSRGEIDEYHRVLHSALLLSGVICLAGVCVAALVAGSLPIGAWLNVRGPSALTIKSAIFWLSLQVLGAIPIGLITGIYRTIGWFPRGQMILNVQRIGAIGLTACVLSLGGGFVSIAAIQSVPPFAALAFSWYDLRFRAPDVHIGFRRADARVCRSLLLPSSFFLLIQGASALSIQGSVMLVGTMLGPVSVTAFATMRTLTNFVRSSAGVVRNSASPELTSLEACGFKEKVRALHSLLTRALVGGASAGGLVLVFFGQDIFALLSHAKIAYHPHLVEVLLVTALIESCWGTSGLLLMATNNHRLVGISYLASSVVALAVGYALVPKWGVTGMAWGLLIGDLSVPCWLIPAVACRLVREKMWVYFIRAGWTATKVLSAVGLLLALLKNPLAALGPRWQPVAMSLGVLLCLPIVGYWLILNQEERDRVRLFANAHGLGFAPSPPLSQVR